MTKPKPLPSQSELNTLLFYAPESGRLTWMPRSSPMFRQAGQPALSHLGNEGYLTGTLKGYGALKSHRVIWKMVYGEEPECIDHINGNRSDNRLVNLRSVSLAENARNLGLCRSNTSGVNGVYWYPRSGKWMASIRLNGRRKNLGYFLEKNDAIAARHAADAQAGYNIRRMGA